MSSYFLGPIVSKSVGNAGLPQFFVVDGQQRLTTLLLLLYALGKAIEVNNDEIIVTKEEIEETYLFNKRREGKDLYKLLLTKHDQNTLFQLIKDEDVSDDGSLLIKNYHFFEEQLEHNNLEIVYKGIQKLEIVDILLNSDSENPQLIFEGLNSKGLELSQTDLIRNYVLMDQDSSLQNRLYETYWCPMEESFGTEHSERFDLFIRDYLTLKTGQIPQKKKVYESFKRHIPDKQPPETLENKIKDIERYSEHYLRIALPNKEQEQDLHDCLKDIHDLKVEAAFPFLLGVYESYGKKEIKTEEVQEICRLIESYIFRRAICDLSTASMSITFAMLASRLKYEHGCFHELRKGLADLEGMQRFPSDDEFKKKFLIKDVYSLRARAYLLRKLENYELQKEPVDVTRYTIERIMPESLTKEWKAELGDNYSEIHDTYLCTIGNLTLTGYNSELSNRSFQEKRDHKPGGFRDGRLHLNRSLLEVEKWNKTAIESRGTTLAEKALRIWRDHGIPHRPTSKKDRTIDDFPQLVGAMRTLFMELQHCVEKLDASVKWNINQRYIAFKTTRVFMTIEPQNGRLRVSLKIPYSELIDPAQLATDKSDKGKSGMLLGSEVFLSSTDDISYVMPLVSQAFEKQKAELLKEQGSYTPS